MGKRTRFVVLAAAAALLLGACHWGTYETRPGGSYVVTIHQTNSNNVLAQCANRNADTEANCALDVIRYACHADGITNWSTDECDAATEHFFGACADYAGRAQPCTVSMKRAIDAVRDPGTAECLGFEDGLGGASHEWFGADSAGGFAGCP